MSFPYHLKDKVVHCHDNVKIIFMNEYIHNVGHQNETNSRAQKMKKNDKNSGASMKYLNGRRKD